MSETLATVGMALIAGTGLFVVGAYLVPPLALWLLAKLAEHFLG